MPSPRARADPVNRTPSLSARRARKRTLRARRTPQGACVRKNPCPSCPFRVGVESGIWAAEEYQKLPAYDLPTPAQPFEVFILGSRGYSTVHSGEEARPARFA